jgi:hypothetical protein
VKATSWSLTSTPLLLPTTISFFFLDEGSISLEQLWCRLNLAEGPTLWFLHKQLWVLGSVAYLCVYIWPLWNPLN